MKLSELIKQDHFFSEEQETILNVMVTSSWLLSELTAVMARHGVTPAQYNVLRILRGSHPQALTCTAVGERLLDRTPDVTRLLNRLEHAGLVHRKRADHDRRVVQVGITEKGLDVLSRMQPDVEEALRRLTRHLSNEDHRHLCELLERLRTDQ